MGASMLHPEQEGQTNAPNVSDPRAVYGPVGSASQQHSMHAQQHTFQASWGIELGPQSMAVNPGVFQTMSALQPLTIRVGEVEDDEEGGPSG